MFCRHMSVASCPCVFQEQDPDNETSAICETEGLRFLVIDMSAVTYIDTAGVRGLEALLGILQANDIQLLLANPAHNVMAMLDSTGMTAKIGEPFAADSASTFASQHLAILDNGSGMGLEVSCL